ncbi:hypothetical protein MesoLj113b_34240 [Mesorhizobium sp. 113-3-3]|nr:hypothetical protein MesoLj113b_34240 [Mesorhizobium sp. 113-3-3]
MAFGGKGLVATWTMPAPPFRLLGESAQEKVDILKQAGVIIVPTPSSFGEVVADTLARMKKAAWISDSASKGRSGGAVSMTRRRFRYASKS